MAYTKLPNRKPANSLGFFGKNLIKQQTQLLTAAVVIRNSRDLYPRVDARAYAWLIKAFWVHFGTWRPLTRIST